MSNTSTSGPEQPATKGEGYGSKQLSTTGPNGADTIFPAGLDSGSVIIRAHPDNSSNVYIGFDDSLTASGSGFPLEPGDSITIDLKVVDQNVWLLVSSSGDEVRWLAVN